jgi:hypothetical protein
MSPICCLLVAREGNTFLPKLLSNSTRLSDLENRTFQWCLRKLRIMEIFLLLFINIITNGRVAWLIKPWIRIGTWICSLRLQSLQITITWSSFHGSFQLALSVPLRVPAPILPGSAKRLGWLGCWTTTRTAFSELELDLPLNCHLTLELLLILLLN